MHGGLQKVLFLLLHPDSSLSSPSLQTILEHDAHDAHDAHNTAHDTYDANGDIVAPSNAIVTLFSVNSASEVFVRFW